MVSSSSDDVVIKVEDLVKSFGDLNAVDGVSFEVHKGEIFGILGPNGAGKTTTLECIEGLSEPTSGRTFVLGMETQIEPENVKQRIGVQLQASAYFDYLTLEEILNLFARFYKRRASTSELLERVGLLDKAKSRVKTLSGGQQQRFTIAATLINEPEVIILDEPTTGLDPQARRSLWDFIQSINADGRTVVLTTHYMEEAEFLCHRIAIMDNGKIVAMDSPENLVRALPVPFEVKIITGSEYNLDALSNLTGVQDVVDDGEGTVRMRSSDAAATVSGIMAWSGQSGAPVKHLEVTPSNLEDVFLSLTGRGLQE
ncbi:MAG: ABC transporter ATP-binding protein [Chloroflexi bacterium]|nr:ABC transporter ATP-binding protein [Chloroflexota bacterium]